MLSYQFQATVCGDSLGIILISK